ncbi:protein transport protein sft2 [Mucor velutinosus]|uniref:Protein transport protein sft2 n=1 Tax=Mucor velutinosus TaxID=708070 RepID=A0AAN7HLG7_9FUNG|nr:protein transport protein sft2 [Mucor velutinosus]
MLTTRKIALDNADRCRKQEPLDVFRTAKSESDVSNLDNYRKVSSTIEKIPTNTPLEIKVEPQEMDTKLALVDPLDIATDNSQGLKAHDNRPELDLKDKKTPENQGELFVHISYYATHQSLYQRLLL